LVPRGQVLHMFRKRQRPASRPLSGVGEPRPEERCWARTPANDPPPTMITSKGRASGRADLSVLCSASSNPLHVYRPRISLEKSVTCDVGLVMMFSTVWVSRGCAVLDAHDGH
jgi:hypothetical protein